MKKNLNKAVGFLAYSFGRIKPSNHPTVYSIETTNLCNLDCIMCPRRDMKRKVGFMNFNTFKKIIDETKNYSPFIWLHQMGEPLLDKNIFKFVNYCQKNGVKTGFSTNATLLNKENSKKIIESALGHLVISLDGSTKKTYEKIRKKADFEESKKKIRGFLKEKTRLAKGPYTVLQIIRMKETEPEIEQFKKEWINSGVDEIYVKDFCTWAGQLGTSDKISEQNQRYNKGIISKRPPCFFLWYSLNILWITWLIDLRMSSAKTALIGPQSIKVPFLSTQKT